MKKFFLMMIAACMLCTASFAAGDDIFTFMGELDKKETATYGDALKLFDSMSAKNVGLSYDRNEPLTKGMISLMTAKYLDLDGSLMYTIFGTERYAFKACVDAGIMNAEGSENDLVSGPELLEIMSKISIAKGQ